MRRALFAALAASFALTTPAVTAFAGDRDDDSSRHENADASIQLGPRPFFLVDGMDPGALKSRLQKCERGPFHRTNFSISHRGAPLQFPEHTKEGYQAAARMGAGIIECDVTFTKDGQLVCRHDECDLHTTTNIVDTPLNAACTTPWSGPNSNPRCCTSDLTLTQFNSLKGKMDASNPAATTAAGYLGGTPPFRTDLYNSRGTLLTLREHIALIRSLGAKHTPELKAGNPARIAQVFGSQEKYAQAMIDEYKRAHVNARDVYAQSFNLADVIYWVTHEPAFGKQAVYLDDVDPSVGIPPLTAQELRDIHRQGVRIFAPPIPALLAVDSNDQVVPSQYALDIKAAGLDIISWSFERADLRQGASKAGFYYAFDPDGRAIKKDSDMYLALEVLAQDVGIRGLFSDWPATVSYYASCMGLD